MIDPLTKAKIMYFIQWRIMTPVENICAAMIVIYGIALVLFLFVGLGWLLTELAALIV